MERWREKLWGKAAWRVRVVRFCGKLFGFSELVRVGCGKKVSDGFEDESIEFTISTHPTIITTNIFKKMVFNNKEVIWS